MAGFIYSVKGRGNFVSHMQAEITEPRINALVTDMTKIVRELKYLNVSEEIVKEKIREIYKGEGNEND